MTTFATPTDDRPVLTTPAIRRALADAGLVGSRRIERATHVVRVHRGVAIDLTRDARGWFELTITRRVGGPITRTF